MKAMYDNDLLFVKIQAIEKYAEIEKIPPKKVVSIFKSSGIFDILEKHYDVLHTQSPRYIVEYVEDIVRRNESAQRN